MSTLTSSRAGLILAIVGAAGLLILLPTSWPGFASWQPQMDTFSLADGAGQSFVLEFDAPSAVVLPAAFAETQPSTYSKILAHVTVVSATSNLSFEVPVRIERENSRLLIPLSGISARAGSRMLVELRDPDQTTWVWGAEHDAYPQGGRMSEGVPVDGDLAFRVSYQRSVLELLAEGARVAFRYPGLLLAGLFLPAAAGLLISGGLRQNPDLDLAALLSLGISGGFFSLAMLGLAAGILHVQMPAAGVLGLAVLMGSLGLFFWLRPPRSTRPFDLGAAGLLLAIVFFGLLRLAFAAAVTMPPHVDAVQHYLLVSDILAPDRLPAAANQVGDLVTRYYHLGFHGMAAWVFALAGGFTPTSLLVLGQLIQAAVVGAIYFPVYTAVQDRRAALAAVVAAGLGWSMPAYASNWAKYPALLGLTVLPAVLGLILLVGRSRSRGRAGLLFGTVLLAAGMALIHTRMLFVLAAFTLALEAARRLEWNSYRKPVASGHLALAVGGGIVAALAMFAASRDGIDAVRQSLSKLVEAQGSLSTLLVIGLAPLAMRRHRRATLALMFWIWAMLLFELVPPNPAYPFPLLDSPMVSMAVFTPMAGLAGLGVSGLLDRLRHGHDVPPFRATLRPAFIAATFAAAGWAITRQEIAPGECCLLAGPDDVSVAASASAWLPADSRVLIPSLPHGNAGPSLVDGGAWFSTLAQRRTFSVPNDTDLLSPTTHHHLCLEDVTHVYVGGAPLSFRRAELDLAPSMYSPIWLLPGAALYAMEGCIGPRPAAVAEPHDR